MPDVKEFKKDNDDLNISVDIEDSELCPRYSGITISGVKIGPSPEWLQNRLKSIGLEPRNNIVDITNFVLLEHGQPMHAFDLPTLSGGIQVRLAEEGEPLTLLGGQEVKLNADTLVIADGKKAVAMAGIMGGAETSVTDTTKDIFLESAFFT